MKMPAGWTPTDVESVCLILDKHRIPLNAEQRKDRKGKYPYYGANGQVDSIDDFIFDGDHILIAEDGGAFDDIFKKVAYAVSGKFWVNNHAHILKCLDCIIPGFLVNALNSVSWIEYVGGSTRLKLTQSSLRKVPLMLPPLNEQRRIVTKIEELTDRTRKAREALEDVPQLIEQFRRSVLAAAFRGDLTADWREQNPDVEPAEKLLEAARDEVEKRKSRKIKQEIPNPYDLPESWYWADLASICCVLTDGDHQAIPKSDEGIPVVDIRNISNGTLDFETSRFAPSEYWNLVPDHKRPEKNDILYSVVGTYGIAAIVDIEKSFCLQRNTALLKLSSIVEPRFLLYALRTPCTRAQADSIATGTTQKLISLSRLGSLKIPLPPYEEQIAIFQKVKKFESRVLLLESQYSESIVNLAQLDRAILAKAFQGQLVPQDPTDEPASQLLQRIRSEREKLKPKEKPMKKQKHP
jgi:type I restriction enzyme S subunit